jgi:predicted HAD superfamily phosphohydrolase YqeG
MAIITCDNFTSNVFYTAKIILSCFQVGDRYFTDVVYGNRNGFLTVLTEPLNFANESYIVRQVCYSIIL